MVALIPPSQSPSVPLDVDPAEPHAAAIEAANETEMPLPCDRRKFVLGGMFGLGVLAALYVASSIILPVMLACGGPCCCRCSTLVFTSSRTKH